MLPVEADGVKGSGGGEESSAAVVLCAVGVVGVEVVELLD